MFETETFGSGVEVSPDPPPPPPPPPSDCAPALLLAATVLGSKIETRSAQLTYALI